MSKKKFKLKNPCRVSVEENKQIKKWRESGLPMFCCIAAVFQDSWVGGRVSPKYDVTDDFYLPEAKRMNMKADHNRHQRAAEIETFRKQLLHDRKSLFGQPLR